MGVEIRSKYSKKLISNYCSCFTRQLSQLLHFSTLQRSMNHRCSRTRENLEKILPFVIRNFIIKCCWELYHWNFSFFEIHWRNFWTLILGTKVDVKNGWKLIWKRPPSFRPTQFPFVQGLAQIRLQHLVHGWQTLRHVKISWMVKCCTNMCADRGLGVAIQCAHS